MVYAPLRSALSMCHWHIAPSVAVARYGAILRLACTNQSGTKLQSYLLTVPKEDASAKKIFSYRIILSVLLKLCVNEYQHCSLTEIVSYIEAVREGSIEVSPGLSGESVRRGNVESSVGSEKRTYFDIYFDVHLPGANKKRIYYMEKAPEVVKYLYEIFENANYGEYFDKYVTREDIEKEPGIRKELNSMSGIAALNFREGKMEGQMEGRMEGRKEGRIISLYYDADLSVEEIAKKVNCAISDVEAVLDNMDAAEIE